MLFLVVVAVVRRDESGMKKTKETKKIKLVGKTKMEPTWNVYIPRCTFHSARACQEAGTCPPAPTNTCSAFPSGSHHQS